MPKKKSYTPKFKFYAVLDALRSEATDATPDTRPQTSAVGTAEGFREPEKPGIIGKQPSNPMTPGGFSGEAKRTTTTR